MHHDRITKSAQVKPPGQRARSDGRLEEPHAFRADGGIGATAGIGSQCGELLHVCFSGQQRPLRTGRGVDGDIPVLVHGPQGVLGKHHPIGADAGRSVVIDIGLGRGIVIKIHVGFTTHDIQSRAPRAVGGVLRGDLEEVIATSRAGVGIDLRAAVGSARIPSQHVEPAEFRGESITRVGCRRDGKIDANEISIRSSQRAVKYERVHRLARTEIVISADGRDGSTPDIEIGVRIGRAEHDPPAR